MIGAVGNRDTCGSYIPISPQKAWNVLSVGGYSDNENEDWTDDRMWSGSVYLNPTNDGVNYHEKPEVVAPAVKITTISLNGSTVTVTGTSVAAPQVTGEAALLIQRNNDLRNWPEVLRSIIMVSATNNVDGASGMPTHEEIKDGAGGINIDLADQVARNRGSVPSSEANRCYTSCWWGEWLTNSMFDESGYRYYYFQGNKGDRIRVVLNWLASADCPATTSSGVVDVGGCRSDALKADFNLGVFDSNGNVLPFGWSASWANNHELVPYDGDLVLPATGTYRIGVHRASLLESTYIGLAWLRLPQRTGTLDNRNPQVEFEGYWAHNSGIRFAAWDTLSWTDQVGSKVSFSFEGDRISRIYSMAYNRGFDIVRIDGVKIETASSFVSEIPSDVRRNVIRTWQVSPGPHTIEIEATGTGFIDIDGFAIDIATVGVGTYDDTHSHIRYIEHVNRLSGVDGAYNGTISYSNVPGRPIRFTFTGDAITWYHSKAPNRGKAGVVIDGVSYGVVDLYAPTVQRYQSVRYANLGPGVHTFHITVLNDKNPSSTDYVVDVDALVVE